MTDTIPVNAEVLRWAREKAGMTIEAVAEKMKKSMTQIEAWEHGEESPTYLQLETLAYKLYQRPLALFFFPEPPEEEDIEKSFRTLPVEELQFFTPRIRFLLRKAKVLQLNLVELFEGIKPVQQSILRDLDFSRSTSSREMAESVRAYLGIALTEQERAEDADAALKLWRTALEEHGVFVFKDSFNIPGAKQKENGENPLSGFCLYDQDFPVIYVNNNKPKTRQIFTLFHELAHLLMHTGGIDTRRDDFIDRLTGDDRRIEILCNRFAADVLVPASDFEARLSGFHIDDQSIFRLADVYHVSREVILRRLLDWQQISPEYYDDKIRNWYSEKREKSGSGGNHYLNKGVYLGERYIERVISQYQRRQITLQQAADYLGEKPKGVPEMEQWLFRQGTSS